MTPTMRELLEKVTRCPGPDWIYSIPDLSSVRAEIRSRLTPNTIKAVLEALEGIESVVSREANAANSISGEMGARLSDVRTALHLLNGTTQL